MRGSEIRRETEHLSKGRAVGHIDVCLGYDGDGLPGSIITGRNQRFGGVNGCEITRTQTVEGCPVEGIRKGEKRLQPDLTSGAAELFEEFCVRCLWEIM